MSDNKTRGDSERALARLLAEALRPHEGAASDSDCPDAGLLAAYADHNLDATETARWEEHFAGCDRCQKILAVLTVSGEEPLSEAELESFGRKLAAAEIGAPASEPRTVESRKIALFVRPRTTWRWLAPAAGIAAAAALWIALRPAPPRGGAAVTAQKAQNANVQPSAPPGESLEARADVPVPPIAASREAETRPAEQQQLKSLVQPPPVKKESQQPPADVVAPRQLAAQADSAATGPQPAAGLQAAGAAAAVAAPTAAGNSPEATVAEESRTTASTAALPAAPAPAAASATASGAEAKSAQDRPAQAFAARSAIAGLVGRAPVVLASPNRSVLWRLSPGGRIERSADQGRTWQQQSSGVTSDLLAGAATSDTVAWIAGRAGVILRTTDGEHWQRVNSPGAATDWTGIESSDALHATITSADRRRFATEDGGQTWKQQ